MLKVRPNISVITICCNRLEYTARTVASVTAAMGSVDYEYIVVNGASEDGTREWLEYVRKLPYYRRIRPIHLEKNTGMMDAFSHGVVSASSDLLVMTDNDILVHSKEVGEKIMSSGKPYGMADFVQRQRNRTTEYVSYPVAFFYMRKKHYVFGMVIPDDYQTMGMRFFVHRDIVCEHIDGADANDYVNPSMSKVKYPVGVIYKNKQRRLPPGHFKVV